MTPKHVHLQRGERLLWLDHRDDIIDHTHFPGPTDPESCHDTRDHVENMTLSRKLHSFLPIETKTPKLRSFYPALHQLDHSF